MVTKAYKFPNSHYIGFERLWKELDKMSNQPDSNAKPYPPYNIVKHSDTQYTIEMALAGYKKEDLTVVVDDGNLIISDEARSSADEEHVEYLHRGISRKKFTRSFKLAEHEHVVVDTAEFLDGLLYIDLKVEVPENKRPRNITIR